MINRPQGTARTPLDSASSEPLHPAAREVLLRALQTGYADPRRLHHEARTSRVLLDNARAVVAESLGVRSDEVTFTPSGTHAIHLGLLGLLAGRTRVCDLLVATAVEHSAVLHAGRWHAAHGGRFSTLPVDPTARVSSEALAVAMTEGPVGVLAIQAANPEVGVLQPDRDPGDVPLFVDACASAGRLELPQHWSALAASAHKWGGPAGVGVLLVRRGARWRQPFPGDDRVDERATGFENVPGALAAAAALQAWVAERSTINARHRELSALLVEAARALPDTEVYAADERLPHLVSFSCLYVDGEAIVTELDRAGFGVASGSACTASTLAPSHVLTAMGALTHGNVRVSLGRETTRDDVDRLVAVLPDVVGRIRQAAGAPR